MVQNLLLSSSAPKLNGKQLPDLKSNPRTFSPVHFWAGLFLGLNMTNEELILSLSIGGAIRIMDFDSIKKEMNLAELASNAKSLAKKVIGNRLYLLKKTN